MNVVEPGHVLTNRVNVGQMNPLRLEVGAIHVPQCSGLCTRPQNQPPDGRIAPQSRALGRLEFLRGLGIFSQ